MKAIDQLSVRLLVLSLLYTFYSGICKGKEISLFYTSTYILFRYLQRKNPEIGVDFWFSVK